MVIQVKSHQKVKLGQGFKCILGLAVGECVGGFC